MAEIKHHKVVASLPSSLEANSVYYVRVGNGYDQYVTNNIGAVVAYESNSKLSLEGKVDKVEGMGLSEQNFTLAEKTKLSSLENYDDTVVNNRLNVVESELDGKADKEVGKGLSTNDLTDPLYTKLVGLEGTHWRGTYPSLTALQSGVTDPEPGDYADVDSVGADVERYIWDATDNVWVVQSGSTAPITASQVKLLYESNPDTNAFTDAEKAKLSEAAVTTDPRLSNAREWTASVISQAEAEEGAATTARKWTSQRVRQAILGWWNASIFKTKLDGIEDGATKNATDAQLRDRATHTGVQPIASVSGLQAELDSKADTTYVNTQLGDKADKTTSIVAGTGLSGGGTLAANRTLSVNYGTTAGTVVEGNDSRLSNAREWTAATVTQAEAEAGTATTARKWTAQRVRQAAIAAWNSVTSAWGRGLVNSADAAAGRTALGLGTAAIKDVGVSEGNVMEVGSFGIGARGNNRPIPDNNLDGLHGEPTQIIYYGGDVENKPIGSTYGAVLNMGTAGGHTSQLAVGYRNQDGLHWRGGYQGLEGKEWLEVFTTGNILGTTGSSTTYPMTQKAVTDALNAGLAGKVDKAGSVTSVAGRTGAVVVTKADVGLGSVANVDTTNASNLSSGTVPVARLSGSYGISVTGSAGSATKLATPRTINGVGFDGSANITTTNWGTARTITVGGTGKSVNGGGNVEWTLEEIGAAPVTHSHTADEISDLDASKIISGVFDPARIPRLTQNVIDPTYKAQVSGNVSLDAGIYGVFDLTLTDNAVLEFVMPEVTGTVSMIVRIRQGDTARTVTWPSGVLWLTSEGNAPAAPEAYMISEYIFSTDGVGWIGREGAKN